ncbi:MAG TPA: AMP-binding protein [Acidimicrobiia bacterium]|nr:AMP-binding protein [Acidimicrobiia bacterium]
MTVSSNARSIPRTIADVFAPVLADDPGREALVTRSGRWSYAELDRLAARAAHALRTLGVGRGDRVAGALPNDLDVILAFHGAMRIGAIWVGLNRALAPPEKRYLLDDSGSSLLLCDDATAQQVAGGAAPRVVVLEEGAGEWHDALAAAPDAPFDADVDPYAPAGIAYTSGTTGYPKGAVHSQYNLLLPGAMLVASRGYGAGLRKGDFLPLTILNMQVLTTLLTAQAGGCSIVFDRSDAAGVAEWIRTERVNTWNGPPALIHSLAGDAAVVPDDLATLDEVWSGGGDCPEPMRAAFERKFAKPVLATYGLSEAPTVVSIDPPDGTHVPGGSGRPLPHLAVHVVDDEICLAPTTTGEWAGVYRPMLGYWQRDDATAETLRGGLVHTGDLGFVDDAGFVHIRDRKSLVIIRGGGNVYPAEIERVLHERPEIEACAVVGLPDERLGERVAVAIQLREGATADEEELRAHCLANLAKYKVPERWLFVDGFPRNSMGKIQRRELLALFTP